MEIFLNKRIEHIIGKMKCTVCVYNYYSNSGATRNKCIYLNYAYDNDYHDKIFKNDLTVLIGPLNDRKINNTTHLKKDVTILFLKKSKAVLSLIENNKQEAIDSMKILIDKWSNEQKWWLEDGQFMTDEQLEYMP